MRRLGTAVTASSLVASGLTPVAAVTAVAAGAAAVTAAGVWRADTPAKASLSGSVLILSTSVNGGMSSTEAARAAALGLTVTVATPATWDAMTAANFASYSAVIIGDPSTTACSSSVPADALSTAGTWGPAVTGNVAVLGTAPALGGAGTLISDAIAYAASGSATGLYVSLNCEYSTALAGTAVPLLASVEGGGFTVTGQSTHCPADAGTVNTWQALALSPFNGLTSANLGPWSSPACSVQETFNAFPPALNGLGYYAGATPATFTASDGTTGQAYILAGDPASTGTAALAPSTGGQVPPGAVLGGGNSAAPGVNQGSAGDPVNTDTGDFTQSSTDFSIPTFGPSLDFSRTYDAQAAQAQTQTGTPGPLGYGWTDNWSSSLTSSVPTPVPGDVYTVDGERTTGIGGPATSVPLDDPNYVLRNGNNLYIADTNANRVLEVAGSTGTQWGISMTSGDEYVIAGDTSGIEGRSANGTPATQSLLSQPQGMAVDSSGDLYIADSGNSQVLELAASTGTQWGISMTAGDVYRVAGHGGGASGHSGDGGVATSGFLSGPAGLSFGHGTGDLYIADTVNCRVQEVPAASGSQWGQSMTADDVYTVVGSTSGSCGTSGNGVAANSSVGTPSTQLNLPQAITFSSTGDMYIADTNNNRIVEVPASSGTQWAISMTGLDSYTVAGSVTGASGSSGNGSTATAAKLFLPYFVQADNGTQLYIADTENNEIREVARSGHTEWGQTMTANNIYDIAGTGTSGFSGDGGVGTSAKLNQPVGFAIDGSFNLYIGDTDNQRVRELAASTGNISTYAGSSWTLEDAGNGGPALQASLDQPVATATDSAGNIYIADDTNVRIQEIPVSSHTQFGIAMTAGDVYTIAGDAHGAQGSSGNGGPATSALLGGPDAIAVDSGGNVYIADAFNNQVREIAATNHAQFGITMTAGDIYGIAGNGTSGFAGDGGLATAANLSLPAGLAVDPGGDLLIADEVNNRIQEVASTTHTQYGIAMTAAHVYTIAGSAAANVGTSGDGGPATSALMSDPSAVALDSAGDIYIDDSTNSRIQEVYEGGQAWGQSMTAGDIYTIAGSASGSSGNSGDGGPATSARMHFPETIALDTAGDIYVAETINNQIREIPVADGTQWGQQMQAGYIYTVAGDPAGGSGFSGDGGPASAAKLSGPQGLTADPSGNLYVTDVDDNRLREVVSAAGTPFPVSPTPGSTVGGTTFAGGVTVTEDDGAQVTYYPVGSGCIAPYTATPSGQFCTLPENIGSDLAFSSGTYTFTPQPGTTFTYNSAGQLTGEADSAGDALTVAYGTPLPGAGHCPATASYCQTITAASGRALTVGYNAANLITTVTDPLSRRWTYAYTASDLTSATDPLGNVASYTYGAGTTGNPLNANNLLTITDPNAQPGGPDAGDATVNAYNTAGQVTTQTDPMGRQTSFTYNVNAATGTGTTTAAIPGGNSTVDTYNQGNMVATSVWNGSAKISEEDFLPAQTAAGASAGTQLDLATADGNGNITTTTYDSAGNPVTSTAPDGVGTQPAQTTSLFTTLGLAYCTSAAIASTTCTASPGPGATSASPGATITPPSSAPPLGLTWTLYDTDGNQLYTTTGVYQPGASTASYAQTTYQLFNGNSVTLSGTLISCTNAAPSASLPCATINANGTVTQLTYNSAGDLTQSSTPDGNAGGELATTTSAYDSDGEPTSTVAPDGNLTGANAGNYTTTTVYNADGQTTSVTQGNGTGHTVTARTTSYGHDGNGNQTTVQDARGFTTTTTYDADDEPTLVTDPDGNATLTCYDSDGNAAQTVPPVGVAANSLTPASCPTSYPSGYSTRLASDASVDTFDAAGNVTQTTTPAPAGQSGFETAAYTYDGNGNMLTATVPPASSGGANQVTVDTYNSADELAAQTTGSGTSAAATVSYCYDPNGDKTSLVYGDGNTGGTASCETSSPWVVSSSSFPTQAGYQTSYAYDSAGELVSATTPATTAAPSGGVTTDTYDPAGNKLTSADPNGVTTTWAYTPLSKIATISYSGSSAHAVSYTYDANGSETAMTDATGSSSYAYNPFGELTSATNGASQVTGYGYNADDQVTSITYPLPAGATWATSATVTYAFDNADSLTSVTDFNGNSLSVGDTADGLPNSVALGASGDSIATTYDNTDTPALIKLKNSTATLQSFSYSDAPAGTIATETDTPTSAQSPATYSYDAGSRVTSMTPGTGSPLSYTFDASSNLTTLPTGASTTYDKAGELTASTLAGTTTAYTYNADGQRLKAAQGSTTLATAGWNGAGELTSYNDGAANMTAATYDGNGVRASATTGAGTQNFAWNAASAIPNLIMDSNNAYIYSTGSAPAEQVNLATGAVTYLVSDLLGSIRGIVNSSGSLTATTSYDAWGNPVTTGGLTSATPFGYAGGYTDPTGLSYLLARYYEPGTGQFISVDPELPATAQPYAYANGDPVFTADPTGQAGDPVRGRRCIGYPWGWCALVLKVKVPDPSTGDLAETFNVTVRTRPYWNGTAVKFWVLFHRFTAHNIGQASLAGFEATVDASKSWISGVSKLGFKNYSGSFTFPAKGHNSVRGRWVWFDYTLQVVGDFATKSDTARTANAHCATRCKFKTG